jgi:hypothetical protein
MNYDTAAPGTDGIETRSVHRDAESGPDCEL